MILGFSILLGLQLIGELIVVGFALPIPGPVLGMILLVMLLVVRGNVPEPLRALSSGLLSNLALLFVPAGVGLILHFELLRTEWWIILLALVVSSVVAAVVTASVFRLLMKRDSSDG